MGVIQPCADFFVLLLHCIDIFIRSDFPIRVPTRSQFVRTKNGLDKIYIFTAITKGMSGGMLVCTFS